MIASQGVGECRRLKSRNEYVWSSLASRGPLYGHHNEVSLDILLLVRASRPCCCDDLAKTLRTGRAIDVADHFQTSSGATETHAR